MNDTAEVELMQRVRSEYPSPGRDPDWLRIRRRADTLVRRRRRRRTLGVGLVAASLSVVGVAMASRNGDGDVRVSTADAPESGQGVAAASTVSIASTKPNSTIFVGRPTTSGPVTSLRPNNEVNVLVANGSGRDSYATNVDRSLATLGYTTLGPANARPSQNTSFIFSRAGFELEGFRLAQTIGAQPAIVRPMPASLDDYLERAVTERAKNADLVVILGSDAHYLPTSTPRGGTQPPSTSRLGA